ncbi:MAG: DNA repair protein RadC [Weeksellaceae bacterium]|jgi:DNA repair protein RadC|nr:DNA repair protein RadC [Weeksellaceae bacterium]MDX9705619.1 DNA repair protein RadC [Weeksellaceae bacterium]
MSYSQKSIKNWAMDDRPREKMMEKGSRALSDSELLAIIMGSGSKDISAVELAKQILNSVDNNWNNLSKLSVKDLCQFKGIGPAKAISIITALEIGRRKAAQDLPKKPHITCSKDVFTLMNSILGDLKVEEFWVIYLNQKSKVIGKKQISLGGISFTAVDLRIIFEQALKENATGIILVHNHPSGTLKPSNADKKLTESIKNAGNILNIELIEHVIITQKSYFSFVDEGLL